MNVYWTKRLPSGNSSRYFISLCWQKIELVTSILRMFLSFRGGSLSMESALSFVSVLYLCGRREQSDEVLNEVRRSALPISAPILDKVCVFV